jgi:chemotaxis response regulator CheB
MNRATSTPRQELDALQHLIAATPDGLPTEAIAAAMPAMPRRSLQRRLAELVQAGRI